MLKIEYFKYVYIKDNPKYKFGHCSLQSNVLVSALREGSHGKRALNLLRLAQNKHQRKKAEE